MGASVWPRVQPLHVGPAVVQDELKDVVRLGDSPLACLFQRLRVVGDHGELFPEDDLLATAEDVHVGSTALVPGGAGLGVGEPVDEHAESDLEGVVTQRAGSQLRVELALVRSVFSDLVCERLARIVKAGVLQLEVQRSSGIRALLEPPCGCDQDRGRLHLAGERRDGPRSFHFHGGQLCSSGQRWVDEL